MKINKISIAIHMEQDHTYYFYPFSWFMRRWNYIQLPKDICDDLRNGIAINSMDIEK